MFSQAVLLPKLSKKQQSIYFDDCQRWGFRGWTLGVGIGAGLVFVVSALFAGASLPLILAFRMVFEE